MMVYPCCIMKYHPDYAFGDLRKNTLKELITKMDEQMTGLVPAKCLPCWLRNKNKAIDNAVVEPMHRNFV
jgi:sulfatase maturation enzyme AslB (radical SAM superfamily)